MQCEQRYDMILSGPPCSCLLLNWSSHGATLLWKHDVFIWFFSFSPQCISTTQIYSESHETLPRCLRVCHFAPSAPKSLSSLLVSLFISPYSLSTTRSASCHSLLSKEICLRSLFCAHVNLFHQIFILESNCKRSSNVKNKKQTINECVWMC